MSDVSWCHSRQEEDPFLEPADTDVMIGTCQLVLQPLAFNVELNEQLELISYRGQPAGVINVRTTAYRDRRQVVVKRGSAMGYCQIALFKS